ncbi:transcriptional regulator [Vibrio ishigakensis]|uniref:Transcriptional regulator n=1 Tax=Vibrio ishigakensis TaxID=1481914 RepID=A0A0B8PCJ1_9VIBR|nr:transcriptional regulator [Vibrio ishigakensis]
MLDLNLLKVFTIAHKHQSYTKASVELGTSQSAVSQSIKKLESQLGYKLFVKQGRSIATTSRGLKLFEDVDVGLNIIEIGVNAKREFNVQCIEMVMHLIGVGALDGIKMSTPSTNPDKTYADIRSQKVDMVIDYFPTNDSSLVSEPILTESVVVACRSDHPRLLSDTISLDSFQREKHISLKARWEDQKLLDTLEPFADYSRNDAIEVPVSTSGLMLVSESDMIMSCPRSLVEKWKHPLGLKIMTLPFKVEPIVINLVYHKRYINDPAHKEVRATLRARLSEFINKQN